MVPVICAGATLVRRNRTCDAERMLSDPSVSAERRQRPPAGVETHPLNLWRLPRRFDENPVHRGFVNSPPGDVLKILALVFTKLL